MKTKSWSAIILSLIIFFSAAIYYIYALNLIGILISLILAITAFIVLRKIRLLPTEKKQNQIKKELKKPLANKWGVLTIASYFLFLGAAFLELLSAISSLSLISPWEAVNKEFFLFYTLSLILLFIIISRQFVNKKQSLILFSIHLFLSFSIAAIVYKIGYGFDPFIHQATMEMIAKNGFITPKTPYYLGQYGLLITIHKLTGISLYFLNKFLVPIVAALIIPGLTFDLIKKNLEKDIYQTASSWFSILLAASFSFSLFIVTTPQNLSYLFLFMAVFAGLSDKSPFRTIIFSLAAAAIHPISGIPALIWSLWLIFKKYQNKLKGEWQKIISASILTAGSLIIPFALFITSGAKQSNIKLSLLNITAPIKEIFSLKYAGSENWLLNAIYLLYYQYKFIILALIATGVFLFFKNKLILKGKAEKNYAWRGLLSIILSLLAAFILSSQINFQELIAYEQDSFARRILTIILIFSSPFLISAIYWLVAKIKSFQSSAIKIIWSALAIFFISSSLYLAYPRFDKYFNSRGYSTGELDIEAVNLINELAEDKYIVLANQQISAAALKTFGFDNYYSSHQGPLYFYPIPTGGILYQYYLDMVYKNPDKITMQKAMALTGTKEAYLVINKYWHDSGKIIKAAKLSANSWQELGNNDIFIFKYK
jgi:hypothetical protein